MKQFRCSLRMLLGISLFALSIEPAQAQTIDYGSLEALFGEPVTTSATGTPLRSTDVPVTMEIITAADIRAPARWIFRRSSAAMRESTP
jgi:iron complex outermembrane receptor protein